MRKDYTFTGMSTRPAADTVPDGELDYCAELVNDGDGLKRIESSATELTLESGDTLLYRHKDYYIFSGTRNGTAGLYALTSASGATPLLIQAMTLANIKRVSSLGLYLVVLTTDGVRYALLQDSSYEWLGAAPSFMKLRFGLSLQRNSEDGCLHALRTSEKSSFTASAGNGFQYLREGSSSLKKVYSTPYASAAKNTWVQSLQTAVNRLYAELNSDGLIAGDVWVRCGYRMKTGEVAALSAPVLLRSAVSQGVKMLVGLDNHTEVSGSGFYQNYYLNAVAYAYKLVVEVIDNPLQGSSVSPWKELIDAVEIYMTKPDARYDYSDPSPDEITVGDIEVSAGEMTDALARGEIQQGSDVENTSFYPYCGTAYAASWASASDDIPSEAITSLHATDLSQITYSGYGIFSLNRNADESSQVTQMGPFYRILQIKAGDFPATGQLVTYDTPLLENLTQQSVLEDTYRELDGLSAEQVLSYNARLNLANIKYSLFAGYPALQQTPLVNTNFEATQAKTLDVYVAIEEQGREVIVKTSSQVKFVTESSAEKLVLYAFYYPNRNAKRAYIYYTSGGMHRLVLELEESPSLNGAYWINEDGSAISFSSTSIDPPTESTDKTVNYASQVMQSNVASVVFSAGGVQTVGDRQVLALATTAKSIHAYQSGQDPLYVFAEDAVWAMSLADDGTYLTCRPATFDAVRPGTDVVQTDDSVAFLAKDGLRVLSGGESVSISDVMDSQATFNKAEVAKDGSSYIAGFEPADISTRFRDFLAGAFLAFDNENKRLYVFNTEKTYGYVFNKRTKTWSLTGTTYIGALQHYPEVYLITSGKAVKKPVPADSTEAVTGLVITRPIEAADDLLFNVKEVMARGVFTSGCTPQLALYGTLDYVHWQLIATAAGPHRQGIHCPPFKAIRLAVSASMKPRDSLTGFSIEYQPRHTARLR